MKNHKKTLILVIFLFLINNFIFSQFEIYFIYKNKYYEVSEFDKKEILIEPFNALKEIDQSQTHRVLLNTIEKSRLSSLFYVGDSYEFNNIELQLINTDLYNIIDKENGINIRFSLGYYDNIIIHSAINFNHDEFNVLDKFATSLTVKYLLKKMTGKSIKHSTEIDDMGFDNEQIEEEYEKFIEQLKMDNPDEVLKFLTKYVEYNFDLQIPMEDENIKKKTKDNINGEDWVHPAWLYFYKKGNYKSFALFYYYTLDQLGYKVRSYFVCPLEKKDEDEIKDMITLIKGKYSDKNYESEVQNLEMQYKYVNKEKNITDFILDYNKGHSYKPSNIYYYEPPDLKKAVFLITVEIDGKWLYTTGDQWVDGDIMNNPERVCNDYAKGGCYYSYISYDYPLLKNMVITEKEYNILWDVFY